MLKNKKSQGSSILLIVAAVIGLIILVVIIAMVGGKLGSFNKGGDEGVAESAQKFNLGSCKETCKLVGKVKSSMDQTATNCITAIVATLHPQVVPGSYSDVPANKVCCCRDFIP